MSNWSHSLEDFLAFNDEILALSRAGVPLDRHLRSAARQIRGRRGHLLDQIAARLEEGTPLDQALAEIPQLPPIYQAVVQAGLRAGNLTSALEEVAGVARRMQEVRINYLLAMIYPSILLMLAGGFIFTIGYQVWSIMAAIVRDSLFLPVEHPLAWGTQMLADAAPFLGLLCPLGVLVMLGTLITLALSRRAILPGGPLAAWIPGLRGVAKFGKQAIWLDVMAMLVERQVPLPEAARLAAQTTGDQAWIRDMDQWAAQLERGEVRHPPRILSHFSRWLLEGTSDSETLARWLRVTSEMARDQADRKANWIRARLTLYLGVGLGGGIVGIYAVGMILPWVGIIEGMLHEHL